MWFIGSTNRNIETFSPRSPVSGRRRHAAVSNYERTALESQPAFINYADSPNTSKQYSIVYISHVIAFYNYECVLFSPLNNIAGERLKTLGTRRLLPLRRNSRLNGCIKMSLRPSPLVHRSRGALRSPLVGTAAITIGSRLDAVFFSDPVTTRVMKMYECFDEAVTHRGTDLSRLPWEIMKRGSPAARRRQ
ncbi:unnamed protein product [Euphydryas editha]|uniref:Uncharacterized protein n=1 Tax=Euphydryas editha TaxID=104508 RepID=A0AAU9VEE7_EUPED|nr:unnamed protein product [Euphydryas editha]